MVIADAKRSRACGYHRAYGDTYRGRHYHGNGEKQMNLFKELSEIDKVEYRKWARDNYKIFSPISGIWHPIIQEECVKMNIETGYDPFKPMTEY